MSTGNKHTLACESGVQSVRRAVISHYVCPTVFLVLLRCDFYLQGSLSLAAVPLSFAVALEEAGPLAAHRFTVRV